jgi:hypothetical protein
MRIIRTEWKNNISNRETGQKRKQNKSNAEPEREGYIAVRFDVD